MKHILITSGGTVVPIDPVRAITNNSTGYFGAEIAKAALKAGMKVTYLVSQHGQSPFTQQFDFYKPSDWIEHEKKLQAMHDFSKQYRDHYEEHRFYDFNDYAAQLKKLSSQKPNIIVLAAAVSDYLIDHYSDQKIRSSEQLQIQLKTAPKLIHFIRDWSPASVLVGFKLLVKASDDELVAAAKKSMAEHHLDLCVANDLLSLKRHAHEIIIVNKDSFKKHTRELASSVIAACLEEMTK